MKFLAKPDTWYDEGTEVKILQEHCTVFDASRKILTLQVLCSGLKDGEIDEELCVMDEFYIVSDDFCPA